MKLVYYNTSTTSYAEFDIEISKKDFEYYDANNFYDSVIDLVIDELLKFGNLSDKINIFPIELLENFIEDKELDIFLLAPYSDNIKNKLKKSIYLVLPQNIKPAYFETKTMNIVFAYAISQDSIMFEEIENETKETFCIGKKSLEDKYIQISNTPAINPFTNKPLSNLLSNK